MIDRYAVLGSESRTVVNTAMKTLNRVFKRQTITSGFQMLMRHVRL